MPEPAPGNVVFDLDGVVYLAGTGIPGAGDALEEIDSRGYRMVFATNAAIRTPRQVAGEIADLTGYAARPDQVVTSAMAPMNPGYTPAARSMVPPLMPGTRLASPISVPPRAPRRTSRRCEPRGT